MVRMSMDETIQAPSIPYTPNQRAAIETIEDNLQIVACAGAGKTDVVAERIVKILKDKAPAIRPRNVVAFTFTERAGAELKDRVTSKVVAEFGDLAGMAEMYVGTIHGYCLQLLQTHIPEYFKYQVLNEVQNRLLVDRASKKSGMSGLGLKRWVESNLYLDVLNVLREGDVDFDLLEESRNGEAALEALQTYQDYLDDKRYLDYTEILIRASEHIASDENLRRALAKQVKYLVVDEYQDVNHLQEFIIREIQQLGANLCVVGDDDQTIYQWRGSEVRNILTFSDRYQNVTRVAIEENYRSSPGVVDAARQVIENNNPDRLQKTMVSADSQTFERGDILCLEHNNPEAEAKWIAKKAKALVGTPFQDSPGSESRGLAPSDFAILLRSVRGTGDPIVHALKEAGLPVVVIGMTNLFDQLEVQAAAAIFHFMAGDMTPQELVDAWLIDEIDPDFELLEAAVKLVEQQSQWDDDERWSTYNLQRTFLAFLEALQITEESIPDGYGEIAFYNLGKFSQVISDYEQIHFQSDPKSKYESFSKFLIYQAPRYYPEGWQEASYVRPDAVQVMTVHQAKGMEWPVVFVPALMRNRFPTKKQGGKNRWHVIPREPVRNADEYDGSLEDERRLFYVALTRSKKYVYGTWAHDPNNKLYTKPSAFVAELTAYPGVLTAEPKRAEPERLEPKPRRELQNIALSFSELKYYFECPYQFKLRFIYGFNPPLHEALGYGKSLHDCLAEVHKRALEGNFVTEDQVEELLARHMNLPFAYPALEEDLGRAGVEAIKRYLKDNAHMLDKTKHVEQIVEINLGNGLVVNGRIDLIRRINDTGKEEIIVIDFKSTGRAQAEEVSRMQLHIYALGYRELTGAGADLIEVYNLDKSEAPKREEVDPDLEKATLDAIVRAGEALRSNKLTRLEKWGHTCIECDLVGVCRPREQNAE